MKSSAVVLGIVVSPLLLAVAGVLYLMAGSQGGGLYRAAIDQVREIQRLSADWSIEVARVRADPLSDFDSLADTARRMGRLEDRLADTVQGIPELSAGLDADVSAYLSAVDAQVEHIERFKTGYAVIRNSTRYLPIAAADVTRQAWEIDDAGLARRIAALSRDMNLYLATPAEADRRRLGEDLERLREASVGYAPPLANALAHLLAHVEVLLDRQAPTDALFRQATSGGLGELAGRLAGALKREQARREAAASRYEQGTLGALGALALFWVVLAVQQRTRGQAAEPRGAVDEVVAATAYGGEGIAALHAVAPVVEPVTGAAFGAGPGAAASSPRRRG